MDDEPAGSLQIDQLKAAKPSLMNQEGKTL
jgi:hypothetical protein